MPRSELPTDASTGATALALSIRHVSKRFGHVQANDDVSFDVAAGSVHALVGENGAGKTTLMRIVYGLYPPDAGSIVLDDAALSFRGPRDALRRGVGMVHQHSLLVGSLSIAENVMLSLPGIGLPRHQQVIARLRALSQENGLGLDPEAVVNDVSVGARQRAEILNALYHGARLLILDEPTTVLTPQEVEQLFAVLRRLNASGTTIMIVTHKLVEVMAVSDAVTVLRQGRHVVTLPTASTDESALVRLMVGRDVPHRARVEEGTTVDPEVAPILRVADLRAQDAFGIERVRGVDFEVRPGEIVAITGIEGNGQTELTEAIVGTRPLIAGTIELGGEEIQRWPVGRRRRAGLAYVPESRMTEGICSLVSVRDNLVLGRHDRRPFARFGLRNGRATGRLARELVGEYAIVAPSLDADCGTLSGGNMQKVVVARELSKEPLLLVAAQPTQGVDVSAAHMIRSSLLRMREHGVGIVLLSSDLSEVCDLADRAVVLFNGTVFGQLSREQLTEEAVGLYAMGIAS